MRDILRIIASDLKMLNETILDGNDLDLDDLGLKFIGWLQIKKFFLKLTSIINNEYVYDERVKYKKALWETFFLRPRKYKIADLVRGKLKLCKIYSKRELGET